MKFEKEYLKLRKKEKIENIENAIYNIQMAMFDLSVMSIIVLLLNALSLIWFGTLRSVLFTILVLAIALLVFSVLTIIMVALKIKLADLKDE